MSQLIHTVCMHTIDAISREKNAVTFNLGGDNPRVNCVKMALGSLEFPVTQYTVEEEWSRLHMSEDLRMMTSAASTMLIQCHVDDRHGVAMRVAFPTYNNPIVHVSHPNAQTTRISTEHPHHLWCDGACVLQHVSWGEALLCFSSTLLLSDLASRGDLVYVDENAFDVKRRISCECGGFLHVPSPPSPLHAAQFIDSILAIQQKGERGAATFSCVYEVDRNAFVLKTSSDRRMRVTVAGSLAKRLGFRVNHTYVFESFRVADDVAASVERVEHVMVGNFESWTSANVSPGWYVPSHRPMCTGQPLRLPQEMELAMNRLFFPMPERIMSNTFTGHFLVFVDMQRQTQLCPITVGKYCPVTFCAVLSNRMTAMSCQEFVVSYEHDRFTIQSEVKQGDVFVDAPFDLLLEHPMQFDPRRIGFDAINLYGQHRYTSTCAVHVPVGATGAALRNVYNVSELGHAKRLRISGNRPPSMVAVILRQDDAIVRLQTYVGTLPFAHGLCVGDIVHLTTSQAKTLLVREERGWHEQEFTCSIDIDCKACVVADDDDAQPHALSLKLPVNASGAENHIVAIHLDTLPFNIAFAPNLPSSMTKEMLGYSSSLLWGWNGSIRGANNMLVPPYESHTMLSLEHPDYILMYIDEGKKSSGLQHTYANHSTTPFAKIVLFPMVREERMLPRDTTLISGESMSKITVRFTNPSGSPYNLHGAHFSISFNFICQ